MLAPIQEVRFYVAQMLATRKVGHVLSVSHGVPRTIGRKRGDLVIGGDEFLSAEHVRLEAREDGVCRTVDLDNTNSVYLRLTAPTSLFPGDHLVIGDTLLRFELA